MEYFTNPLAHPAFFTLLLRVGVLLLAGLLVMTLTQIKNVKGMLVSNAFRKFCSWLIIVPVLMLITFGGRVPFLALVLFMMWKGSGEFLKMVRMPPFYRRVFLLNGIFTVGVMTLAPSFFSLLPALYILVVLTAAGLRNQMFDVVRHIAFSIFGSLWIGYCLALLTAIHITQIGPILVMVIFGVVIVSDVFAFLLGGISRKIGVGTKPLASNISPNKVVAGVVGNIIGALLSFLMFGQELRLPWWFIGMLVILGGIGAAYGDLAESMLKRAAGVKDSSDLIPYHGGMLDRIDSLLFVVPVFYLVTKFTAAIPFVAVPSWAIF